ncbi:MAG: ABC transporter ATP-binding protein [Cellulosilyticaceae bacterium]
MSIAIKDITVSIEGNTIIKEVSLEFRAGEVVALLGLNGAGKTTLIKTIAGIMKSSHGSISMEGQAIDSLSLKERGRFIAYVPQQMSTTFNYQVEDFVLMGVTPYLGVFETPKKKHREEAVRALEFLGIEKLKEKSLLTLSGGERQMVYLARAFVQQASLMVLDEPTAYLDFKKQHQFLGDLREVVRRSHKTVLLSVHDPNLALQYADQIVILHEQTILATLRKDEKNWEAHLQKALDKLYEGKAEMIREREHMLIIHKQ